MRYCIIISYILLSPHLRPSVKPPNLVDLMGGELLYHIAELRSTEEADRVVHTLFRLGLKLWADKFFEEVFGSAKELEGFIGIMKKAGHGGEKPSAAVTSRVFRPSRTSRKEQDRL